MGPLFLICIDQKAAAILLLFPEITKNIMDIIKFMKNLTNQDYQISSIVILISET